MRTTLAIDDDLLSLTKEIAATQGRSMGEVVSDLMRKALAPEPTAASTRNGLLLLDSRGPVKPVSSDLVRTLAQELEA